MAKSKEEEGASVALKEKTKVKKGKIQRLPLGVKEDEFGYYIERVSPRDGHTEIKMEVIFDEDGDRGRARANQNDSIYFDANSGHMLYRGVKVVTQAMGPRPPYPETMYTEDYPGWNPSKSRGRPLAGTVKGSTGHGTRTDLMPIDEPKTDMSRGDKIAAAALSAGEDED